jgi:hypothetical protein
MMNTDITSRVPYSGFDEATYYSKELFIFFVNNYDDPDVYFKLKILGKYAKDYKWTTEQALEFIDTHLEDSRGYYVGDTFYMYDWGSGENKIKPIDKMHEPNLDHILPREQGGDNVPSNFRIRSRRLNENKNNTNSDAERVATIQDFADDIEDKSLLLAFCKEYIDKWS